MAMTLLRGEKLYKILLSEHQIVREISNEDAFYRAIFIKMPDGNLRVIANFVAGSAAHWHESELSVDNADEIISSMSEMLDELECKTNIYDFTELDTAEEQIEAMKEIEDLSELGRVLEARHKWILI